MERKLPKTSFGGSDKEFFPKELPTAFLLAGGRGSRLRPLTDRVPKPLLPVGGKPLILHILENLYAEGVRKAVLLTGYMGQMLEETVRAAELPIQTLFFCEEKPLGSAGCVGAARIEAGERFFVVCADAYGKRDYRGFFENHMKKKATASLLLSKVTDPQEYGLALTDKEGRITEFLEKPSWSRAFTDMANTGVYLFEKRILDYIPKGEFCDFGKDVFPKLMENGEILYGYCDGNFWCDMGDRSAYLLCNLRENGGKSVLGAGTKTDGATVENSLLFDGVFVGKGSTVRGAIVCKNAKIGENCVVPEGCFIGENIVLENGTVLGRGTVLDEKIQSGEKKPSDWEEPSGARRQPDGEIQSGAERQPGTETISRTDTRFGATLPLPGEGPFDKEEFRGTQNFRLLRTAVKGTGQKAAADSKEALFEDLSDLRTLFNETVLNTFTSDPKFFEVLGHALADAVSEPGGVGLMYGGEEQAEVLKALARGVGSVRQPFLLGRGFYSFASYSAYGNGYPLTVLVDKKREGGRTVTLFDRNGMPPSASFIRAVRDRYDPRAGYPVIYQPIGVEDAEKAYMRALAENCPQGLAGVTVGMGVGSRAEGVLGRTLLSLGATIGTEKREGIVLSVSPDGQRSELRDDSGKLDFFHMAALMLGSDLRKGTKVRALPFRLPSVFFELSRTAGGSRPTGFPMTPANDRFDEKRRECAGRRYLFDGCVTAVGVLALMKESGKNCEELKKLLPDFSVVEGSFDCPKDEKLSLLLKMDAVPAGEGMRITASRGRTSLRALGGRGLSLMAEAASDNDAQMLLRELKQKLSEEKNKKGV